ncbi:MAG: 50S ribosomal protein L29 [bacterium]|nr:50S ribosomal protein L29 [bacterium]
MDIKDLRTKAEAELERLSLEKKEKTRDLRFRVARRELKNLSEIKNVKNDLAQILTVLKEKSLKKN